MSVEGDLTGRTRSVTDEAGPGPRKVVRLFYGFQFFFALLLWVPVFYEFERRVGLSDPQIFSIQSFYYLAFCLLEIPTGFLADWLGRRTCMLAGAVLVTVANLVPVFANSYGAFILHFFLVALARSLVSGAASAHLYDYLKAHGAVELYRDAEGRARALSLAGKVVLWSGVGALMEWQLTLPYSLTAAATSLSIGFAWLMPVMTARHGTPEAPAAASDSRLRFFHEIVPVFRQLTRSPAVVLVMVQGVAIFVLSRMAQVDLFQPVLKEKGFAAAQFGIVMALFTVFEALGAAQAGAMRRLWGWLGRPPSDLNSVFLLTIVLCLSVSLLAITGPVGTVAALAALSLVTGAAYPIQRQLMNDVIPDSRYRATFLSFESILDRAGSAAAAALMGDYVLRGEVNRYLQLSATTGLLLILVLIFMVSRINLK